MSNTEGEKSPKIIIGGVVRNHELDEFYKDIALSKKSFDSHIIAYLDFLGFAEKMREENSYESLQILKFLLRGVKTVANQISNTNDISVFDMKIFSDNIIIAQKVEQAKFATQAISITNLVASVQLHALLYFGFLIRGSITIGELSIDSTVVWGTGLIDAYNIENNLANYPRILLSKQFLNAYDSCEQKQLNLYAFAKKDFDGSWFVDFLVAAPSLTFIPTLSEILNDIAIPYANKPDKVKQKINWVIAHFNAYCHKFRERGDYEKYVLSYV